VEENGLVYTSVGLHPVKRLPARIALEVGWTSGVRRMREELLLCHAVDFGWGHEFWKSVVAHLNSVWHPEKSWRRYMVVNFTLRTLYRTYSSSETSFEVRHTSRRQPCGKKPREFNRTCGMAILVPRVCRKYRTDSWVGTATDCEVSGQGIRLRFPAGDFSASLALRTSCTGSKVARGVKLTTHHHLVPRLGMVELYIYAPIRPHGTMLS
jgi:hypothetical protein